MAQQNIMIIVVQIQKLLANSQKLALKLLLWSKILQLENQVYELFKQLNII